MVSSTVRVDVVIDKGLVKETTALALLIKKFFQPHHRTWMSMWLVVGSIEQDEVRILSKIFAANSMHPPAC